MILNKYFGDTEFIITNRGSYKWNDDVKVVLDNELFEKLIGEAKVENEVKGVAPFIMAYSEILREKEE